MKKRERSRQEPVETDDRGAQGVWMTLGLGMIEIRCCFKLWALTSLGAKTCLRIYLPQKGHALRGRGGGGGDEKQNSWVPCLEQRKEKIDRSWDASNMHSDQKFSGGEKRIWMSIWPWGHETDVLQKSWGKLSISHRMWNRGPSQFYLNLRGLGDLRWHCIIASLCLVQNTWCLLSSLSF